MSEPELMGPAEVRRLARALGLRPRKTLGQNFVIDPGAVRRIVRVAALTPDDVVLEVGPGLGSLTLALLPAARRVVAIEADPTLAAALPGTVAERAPSHVDRLEVAAADARRVWELPGPPPTALVANLPYNVAVPVLLHLLELLPSVRRGLVLVQREVADRLVAGPGERMYGVPSAKVAYDASARPAGRVSASVFWPAPNVDSGLVALHRRPPPVIAPSRRETFAVIEAAFGQRRKTLRAALARWAGSPSAAEEALRAAGIAPSARAESLDVADFARLARQRAAAP